VAVAELGLRLRIAQPALSRHIIDLERELGLRLFDRVGRRLLLTGEGEQLLTGCRQCRNGAGPAAQAGRYRRFEDRWLSPTHPERVVTISARGALSEGGGEDRRRNGHEILRLLESGEIHLGQNLLHTVKLDQRQFGSLALGSVELLAACHPSLPLSPRHTMEVARGRVLDHRAFGAGEVSESRPPGRAVSPQ